MKIVMMIFVGVWLAACKNGPAEPSVAGEPVPLPAECYLAVSNKDTIRIKWVASGDSVNGTLDYHFFEKDRNTGTLRGRFHGDTLIGDYEFDAEGTRSVRQVAFLKQGSAYREGYGPMQERGGKMVFSDARQITFDGNVILNKTDCPD